MTEQAARDLADWLAERTGNHYTVEKTEKPIAKGATRLADANSYYVKRVKR